MLTSLSGSGEGKQLTTGVRTALGDATALRLQAAGQAFSIDGAALPVVALPAAGRRALRRADRVRVTMVVSNLSVALSKEVVNVAT